MAGFHKLELALWGEDATQLIRSGGSDDLSLNKGLEGIYSGHGIEELGRVWH